MLIGEDSNFQFFLEKKTKMSKNRETENLRSPRFGLNVLYHRDQAKLDCEFYAAHASHILASNSIFHLPQKDSKIPNTDTGI